MQHYVSAALSGSVAMGRSEAALQTPLLTRACTACRAAFRTVAQLQQAYPTQTEATAYDMALAPVVDACARSVHALDSTFLLEDTHSKVSE